MVEASRAHKPCAECGLAMQGRGEVYIPIVIRLRSVDSGDRPRIHIMDIIGRAGGGRVVWLFDATVIHPKHPASFSFFSLFRTPRHATRCIGRVRACRCIIV